jgi:hypothetical protein
VGGDGGTTAGFRDNKDFSDSPADIAAMKQAIICTLAGSFAEHRMLRSSPDLLLSDLTNSADIDDAYALLRRITPDTQHQQRLFWLLAARAQAISSKPNVWRAIELVAAALLRNGRLSRQQVRELVSAQRESAQPHAGPTVSCSYRWVR